MIWRRSGSACSLDNHGPPSWPESIPPRFCLSCLTRVCPYLLLWQVAGLDVGWGQRVPMGIDRWHRFAVTRHLPAGIFQFKLIVDGHWTYSVDHPTLLDGDNRNNFVSL